MRAQTWRREGRVPPWSGRSREAERAAEGGELREASAAFLLDRAQRLAENEILRTFTLPITWVQFYDSQPGWEWPEYEN